ncbi:hypothetical protein ACFSO0_07205 [Brevibacillus sp. GCM10020057]|uniref:hypothetical protein n=1 Tax=Brevibacillus sp. GCM10020057 TaxID=3317327 RepID=UPI00364157D2
MTNEEIWEWMQRDLDGDLSPVEQEALYSLIRKDSDLQLKFNRLKTVSEQLEKLPPVVPSFSIVDSILPRLESAAAVPAQPAALNEAPLPVLEVKRNSSSPSESRKWKRMKVWLATVGSTAVAACLLIGMMFTGSDGKKVEPDLLQQGTETPTTDNAPLVGPPVPPPSTNLPSSNTQEEEKKKETKTTPPAKKQSGKKVSSSGQPKQPVKPAVVKPAAHQPTAKPKPVFREEKPPAFPYGLEEKSDKDNDRGRESDSNKDKSKENAKESSSEKGKEKKSKEKNKDKED